MWDKLSRPRLYLVITAACLVLRLTGQSCAASEAESAKAAASEDSVFGSGSLEHKLGASIPNKEDWVMPEDLDMPFDDLPIGEVLSLDEVSRMAIARSLQVDIFRTDQAIEEEELGIARSAYDTEVTIDADYEIDETQPASTILGKRSVEGSLTTTIGRLLPTGTQLSVEHVASRSSTGSPFASMPRLYEGSASIAATQPILKNSFGLIDRAKVRLVRLDISRFGYETTDRIEAHVFAVRNAYWNLVFARRELSSKQRALHQAQEFLKTTQDKLLLGLVERQDVYAAEANVRLRIADALEAKTSMENEQGALQVLLDLPEDFGLVPSTEPTLEKTDVYMEESIRYAIERRRDYQQLKMDLMRNNLTLRMKKSSLLPQLDLEASYRSNALDRDLFDAQGEIASFNHPTLFAGGIFSMPLENRRAKAELRQAKLERHITLTKLRRLEQQIGEEVRKAVRGVKLAEAKVEQTREAEVLQRKKLVAESESYDRGRSDSRTIIDFQEDLIAAETQAQRALVGYNQAKDALLRAENRLLEATGLIVE